MSLCLTSLFDGIEEKKLQEVIGYQKQLATSEIMNFKLHYLNLSLVVGIREFRVQFHKGTKAAI